MACASLDVSIEILHEPSAADLEMANAAGMVVSRCEAATLHRRFLAERADRYTAETFAQLDEASRLPAGLYLAAQRLREAFRLRMARLFERVHALALPTTLVTAPRVEEAERFLLVLSRNCIPWSFIGVPAVSLPCGRSAAGAPHRPPARRPRPRGRAPGRPRVGGGIPGAVEGGAGHARNLVDARRRGAPAGARRRT